MRGHTQPLSVSNSETWTHQIHVRDAVLEDARVIAELGSRVFTNTFGYSMPLEDLNTYLEESYNVAAISRELGNDHMRWLVACKDNDENAVIGFVQLTQGTSEPCVTHLENLIELGRLYVTEEFQGRGVAKMLIQRIEDVARAMGFRNIWLGVWESNLKAQRAYEKFGFKRVGEHPFRMGNCTQNDFILAKPLEGTI